MTFDDGYLDTYTNARPLLEQHGLVATYHVVTGRLGEVDKLSPADLRTLVALISPCAAP